MSVHIQVGACEILTLFVDSQHVGYKVPILICRYDDIGLRASDNTIRRVFAATRVIPDECDGLRSGPRQHRPNSTVGWYGPWNATGTARVFRTLCAQPDSLHHSIRNVMELPRSTSGQFCERSSSQQTYHAIRTSTHGHIGLAGR